MPVPRKQAIGRKVAWTDDHLSQLQNGIDWFGHGWGKEFRREGPSTPERDEILEDMRACWLAHRHTIEAEYNPRNPLQRCWAWWQFSSPEPRDDSKPEWYTRAPLEWPYSQDVDEWYQLLVLGELDEQVICAATAEETARHVRNANRNQGFLEFRRPLAWWLWHGPARRDESKLEVAQLVALNTLNDREREILAGNLEAGRWYDGGDASHLLKHLLPAERELLGMPQLAQEIIDRHNKIAKLHRMQHTTTPAPANT